MPLHKVYVRARNNPADRIFSWDQRQGQDVPGKQARIRMCLPVNDHNETVKHRPQTALGSTRTHVGKCITSMLLPRGSIRMLPLGLGYNHVPICLQMLIYQLHETWMSEFQYSEPCKLSPVTYHTASSETLHIQDEASIATKSSTNGALSFFTHLFATSTDLQSAVSPSGLL